MSTLRMSTQGSSFRCYLELANIYFQQSSISFFFLLIDKYNQLGDVLVPKKRGIFFWINVTVFSLFQIANIVFVVCEINPLLQYTPVYYIRTISLPVASLITGITDVILSVKMVRKFLQQQIDRHKPMRGANQLGVDLKSQKKKKQNPRKPRKAY